MSDSADPSRPPSTLHVCPNEECRERFKMAFALCPECGAWIKDEEELYP